MLCHADIRYEETLCRLANRFQACKSAICNREQYTRRNRPFAENSLQFFSDFRTLASRCLSAWTGVAELIRDRLVDGFTKERIPEQLFHLCDKLTLEDALVLTQKYERVTVESVQPVNQQTSTASSSGQALIIGYRPAPRATDANQLQLVRRRAHRSHPRPRCFCCRTEASNSIRKTIFWVWQWGQN